MDRRNLVNVACELFENESPEAREEHYLYYVLGAQFMFERMAWLIGEAAQTDDNSIDPGLLGWIERDLQYAREQGPRWETAGRKPARATREAPEQMPRPRNVLSDRNAQTSDFSIFGEGWNPDRFSQFWELLRADLLPEGAPPGVAENLRGVFLAGISTCFYDIAKVYVKAANAREPQAFRLYLRDFRRSLERHIQPSEADKMH